MRNILLAQKKKIRHLSFSDLGISPEESRTFVQVREISLPPERKAGKIFASSVEEMVDGLVGIIRERTGKCQ
jgi:electron transfer flavoprotein alpha/beta subunit